MIVTNSTVGCWHINLSEIESDAIIIRKLTWAKILQFTEAKVQQLGAAVRSCCHRVSVNDLTYS